MSTYDGYQVLLSMLYSNEEMRWRGGWGVHPRGKGGQVEGRKQALGLWVKGPPRLLLGGSYHPPLPTCSCEGQERSWDVMRVFCSLQCHKRAGCSNSSGGFNVNPWGTVVVGLRGHGEGRIW